MRRIVFVLGIVFVIAVAAALFCAASITHRGFSTRTAPGPVETRVVFFMRAMAVPSHYKSMKNPVMVTPDVLRDGMEHWADHCATCHANNGNGDTMFGKTMYPRPPDMRQKYTQEMSDGELYFTIQNGIMLSGMPAFGAPGDDDLDSWKLVAFIRHLPSLSQGEEMEMQKMNPKSPEEFEEEQQEENFLNGISISSQPQPSKRH